MDLRITDLSRGGSGVAKDPDGRVVFVPFSAPGDLVRVEITETQKKFAQARIVEVLEASPDRVTPRCSVFGRCGGCQWQHISYELQWRTKVGGVFHSLERQKVIGETDNPPVDLFPAERIWDYRNRIQLRGAARSLGFHASKSHEIVAIDRCEIARPELNARLPALRDEGEKLTRPYKVEVEVFGDGRVSETWNAAHSASGFRQIHDEQNVKLQKWVEGRVAAGRSVLDLYGGTGNLSLPLASVVSEVHCVDVVTGEKGPTANYFFHRSAVKPWLARNPRLSTRLGSDRTWTAIIDPPRDGLGYDFGEIASGLEAWGVREIILIGCEVDPWARDLSRFSQRNWKLARVGVLDLFPQTHHVESLAFLTL